MCIYFLVASASRCYTFLLFRSKFKVSKAFFRFSFLSFLTCGFILGDCIGELDGDVDVNSVSKIFSFLHPLCYLYDGLRSKNCYKNCYKNLTSQVYELLRNATFAHNNYSRKMPLKLLSHFLPRVDSTLFIYLFCYT